MQQTHWQRWLLTLKLSVRKRRKVKKDKPKSRNNGPVSVKTIHLGNNALRTWTKKVIYDTELQREKFRNGKNRRPVSVHPCKAHLANVWVLSPRHDEVVLSTRPRTGKKQGVLYCVQRDKKGSVRGSVLEGNLSRMKQGIEDLHLPRW